MKGQTGIEVLVVIGLIITLLIPFVLSVYTGVSGFTDALAVEQADRVAGEISVMTDIVSLSGPGSNASLTITMPSNVESIELSGREVVFNMRTSYGPTEVVKLTKANLSGDLNHIKEPGTYTIFIWSYDTGGAFPAAQISPS